MATIDRYVINLSVVGEKAVTGLSNAIGGLGAQIAGLGIGAFIANSYRMADAMKDLADATGLSSGYIKAFADGLQSAGGRAENVDKILTTFYNNLQDMADGADGAERAFAKLKITFEDLRTLSERQILGKALKELAAMDAGSRRTAAGVGIFGKAFAQIDPKVLEQLISTQNVEGLTKELDKAAAMVGTLEANYRKLQESAVIVVNQLINGTSDLTITSEQAFQIIKAIALVLAGKLFLEALAAVRLVTQSIYAMATALGVANAAAKLLSRSLRVLGIGFVVGLGVELFDKFSQKLDDAGEAVRNMNAVTGDSAAAQQEYAKKINDAYAASVQGLQLSLQAGRITTAQFQEEIKKLDEQRKKALGIGGVSTPETPAAPEASPFTFDEREARARAASAAQRQTELLRNQFELQQQYAQSLLETIGMDEDRAELLRELAGIQRDYDEKRLEYQEKIADELAKGKDANLALVAEYTKQFEALDKQQQATEQLKRDENGRLVALKQTSVELEKQIALINSALEISKNQIEIDKFLAIAKGELSEDEAEYQAQRQTLQAESDARIKELEAALKNEINDINKQKIQNEIDTERARTQATLEGIEQRREAEQEAQRSSAAGFKKVFEEIAKSTSPYQVAVDSLQSAFRSVDNALTEFVTKGKFNFKEFARSLLADIAMIIARALVMRAILSVLGFFSPAAAASLGSMMGMAPIPRAKGGPVLPGQAYLVGEKGPELAMFGRPGTIIPNNQLGMGGGGTTEVTYNINAVDAASFRSLVARDPQFLYSVTEVGRRSNPARRLA